MIVNVQLSYGVGLSEPSSTRFIHSYMSLTVFILRIKKLEKERALLRQCKRNGWTDLCGELEQYEKVLEQETEAESMRFHCSVFYRRRHGPCLSPPWWCWVLFYCSPEIHLQNQLLRIRSDGRKFKNQLREVKPTPKSKLWNYFNHSWFRCLCHYCIIVPCHITVYSSSGIVTTKIFFWFCVSNDDFKFSFSFIFSNSDIDGTNVRGGKINQLLKGGAVATVTPCRAARRLIKSTSSQFMKCCFKGLNFVILCCLELWGAFEGGEDVQAGAQGLWEEDWKLEPFCQIWPQRKHSLLSKGLIPFLHIFMQLKEDRRLYIVFF